MTNSKNDAHCTTIVTRSEKTLGGEVVEKQTCVKIRAVDKTNEEFVIPKEKNVERPVEVENMIENDEKQ